MHRRKNKKNNVNGEYKNNEYSSETASQSEGVNLSLATYWFLAVIRIILTLLPQPGYIHPDEFFQSIEVVTGDIYNVESLRPWEYNSTYPVRSIVVPYIFSGIPLIFLKSISPFVSLWFNYNIVSTYTVLVIPRLICCIFSFLTDYSLYRICLLYNQNYRIRLITLASSYIMLVYSSHTFSNSIEMALVSLLMYLVAECMCRSDCIVLKDEYFRDKYSAAETWRERIHIHKLRSSLPKHNLSRCFSISTVTIIGIFNRPTFLAFAFTPIFFWLQRGMGSKYVGFSEFNKRAIILAITAIPSTMLIILIDSIYFGYMTLAEILNKDISLESNFVVTPYNFIKYNMNFNNLAQHGIHNKLNHLFVNIPLLYNVLGLAAIFGFFSIIIRIVCKKWSDLPRMQSLIGLMLFSLVIPLLILSMVPHQEPRFLIPCTLSIVFLYSQHIRNINETKNVYSKQSDGFTVFLKKDRKLNAKDIILMFWYFFNILCVIFYGFLHQAGIHPLITHISKELQYKPRLLNVHLVTSHMYTIPISLLLIKKYSSHISSSSGVRYTRAKDFFTYELGSSSMDNVANNLKTILNNCENKWKEKRIRYKIYFAIPSSKSEEFQESAFRNNITHSMDYIFYPHVSTEALPNFRFDAFRECKNKYRDSKDSFLLSDWSECSSDSNSNSWDFSLNYANHYISNVVHQFGLTVFVIKN